MAEKSETFFPVNHILLILTFHKILFSYFPWAELSTFAWFSLTLRWNYTFGRNPGLCWIAAKLESQNTVCSGDAGYRRDAYPLSASCFFLQSNSSHQQIVPESPFLCDRLPRIPELASYEWFWDCQALWTRFRNHFLSVSLCKVIVLFI